MLNQILQKTLLKILIYDYDTDDNKSEDGAFETPAPGDERKSPRKKRQSPDDDDDESTLEKKTKD